VENAHILKITLMLAVAAALTGCSRFYEKQEAAFEQRLPQLVADCNEVFRGSDRPASWDEGVKACKQLSDRQRLDLVEIGTVNAYMAYQSSRASGDTGYQAPAFAPPLAVPMPLPQVQ
jgi:hypothetical protein